MKVTVEAMKKVFREMPAHSWSACQPPHPIPLPEVTKEDLDSLPVPDIGDPWSGPET